jgi:hypothetical protein
LGARPGQNLTKRKQSGQIEPAAEQARPPRELRARAWRSHHGLKTPERLGMEPLLRNVLFCDAAVPLVEGRLTAYGVFTDVYAERFPHTLPRFSLLCSWTQAPGFHMQQIKMLNPARSLIMHQSPESYFTLGHETETAHVVVDVNQVVFTEPGSYVFEVWLDGRPREQVLLHVRRR